jgi:hypothetical protein
MAKTRKLMVISKTGGAARDTDPAPGISGWNSRLLLADVRAVRVGGIDEVDPELECPPQHTLALLGVGRRPPDARPVRRIGPKPKRLTVMSPTVTVPALYAS